MLGKNLPLRYFCHDPVCDATFLSTPAIPFLHIPALPGFSVLGKYGDIYVDTIALALVVMALILAVAAFITPKLTSESAGGTGQNLLEMYYGFITDLTKGQIGHAYKTFFPLIAAIFIFVLVSNFLGVGPWKMFESFPWWPHLGSAEGHAEAFEVCSPTTDFNVTFALATVSILTYLGSGFWVNGLKYFMHYLNPIEWLDLVIRPSTLALRLMLVITADELMRGAALSLAPVLIPTGVMSFELFIGLIQAFVFALLTSIYIGLTVAHH